MRKISKFALNVVVYLLIVGGLLFGLPRFLSWALDTPYPMAAITSGSMWPVLKEGDLVFIKGVDRSELAVGNIIVYRNRANQNFTIHRIVSLGDETLTTKGDANFNKDKPVAYGDVVGRAVAISGYTLRIPYLGLVTVAAGNFR